MKLSTAFLFTLLLLFTSGLHAQATPNLTYQTAFYRFQCDPSPVLDVNGVPIAALVRAFWQTTVTDTNGIVPTTQSLTSVSWDAIAKGASTVTIPGPNNTTVTLTYLQVLQAVMAIATQEKAAGGPP